METWHIHITGRVQGVGFRPFVYRQAVQAGLFGSVSNAEDGVHVQVNGDADTIRHWADLLVDEAPVQARVRGCTIQQAPWQTFTDFRIVESISHGVAELLITPDIAFCNHCRTELQEAGNRRYGYPFTTCTDCGPRYSIQQAVPFDRSNTGMAAFTMCHDCQQEYQDPDNRRFYSQTNSCPNCGVPMHLYDKHGQLLAGTSSVILELVSTALKAGFSVAVKGLGGYLMLVDGTNRDAVERLRARKRRPTKPFAVLYPNLDMLASDCSLTLEAMELLSGAVGPIVLLPHLDNPGTGIALDVVAPHNPFVGAMLPSTPLLQLLADAVGKPLVATSANGSGSPIVYDDEVAVTSLGRFVDFIITHGLAIVSPQDDSVIRLQDGDLPPVVLRRSRGFAPGLELPGVQFATEAVLALGGDIKSAFALQQGQQLFVSQYLGDLASYDTQEAFQHTLRHLMDLTGIRPRHIVADSHPGYFSHKMGQDLARKWGVPLHLVQHHEAHAAAILQEHGLWGSMGRVLCVTWDGAGLGSDGQLWGGESFLYSNGQLERVATITSFPQLLGDKMSQEPRLSALSLCRDWRDRSRWLQHLFLPNEWQVYTAQVDHGTHPTTSSIGRLFDGICGLLGLVRNNTYEAEAAMRLEFEARVGMERYSEAVCSYAINDPMTFSVEELMVQVRDDLIAKSDASFIAARFHLTLAHWVALQATTEDVSLVALSGGVMQNTLLTSLIRSALPYDTELFVHQLLSPNDESLAVGQLALWQAGYVDQQEDVATITVLNQT